MRRIHKVLVANRGEIAIRVFRACSEMGIRTVAIYSKEDILSLHRNRADEAYLVGEGDKPIDAYLDIEDIIRICKEHDVDAIHPGYGFLAENAKLAQRCEEEGIIFIGPKVEHLIMFGDKVNARIQAEKAQIPMIPGTKGAVHSFDEVKAFAETYGFPVMINAVNGGGGRGMRNVDRMEDLEEAYNRARSEAKMAFGDDEVYVERCIMNPKHIEVQVMGDEHGNVVHLFERDCSIQRRHQKVIEMAPAWSLPKELRKNICDAAVKLMKNVHYVNAGTVEFLVDQDEKHFYFIEVNPRVSRSSALASKATGYPIAKVAAKIALGLHLDEITNAITGNTKACFEPSIDYVVCKFPRWPFEKFTLADRAIGTQMKATGEVMALDRTLEGSLLKALRSLEVGEGYLHLKKLDGQSLYDIRCLLSRIDNERIFVLAEALRRGIEPEEINRITKIDLFFIYKIQNIIKMERRLMKEGLTEETLKAAKRIQMPDEAIAHFAEVTPKDVENFKKKLDFHPDFKMVDTCAAEFEAHTPYYYSTYGAEDEVKPQGKGSVVVFGSGPIRIGQGIEFDYCSVHASWALRKAGKKSIVINNNPETVSTDFDTSDSLYFEPLTEQDVLEIIDKEKPEGVICQFGGQTAINLATPMAKRGIRIIGSSNESIDMAEDRERFDTLMGQLGIARPKGCLVESVEEAMAKTEELEYPLIVRPSYVLGGRAMQIVYDQAELRQYLKEAVVASHEHPVLIDQYMVGREVEVDAISDGNDVCIPGIMEQIERSGVHSGDSIAVYPPQHLSQEIIETLTDYTREIAKAMNVKGLVNIQFIVVKDKVYVIEVNPRASRTVPFMSKITGINMVEYATRIALGESLKDTGLPLGLVPDKGYVAIKAPVFSFSKLGLVEIKLGPEMKSTGEVMGIGHTYQEALYKAVVAAHLTVPAGGNVLITVSDRDKPETAELAKGFVELGYHLICTSGTGAYFEKLGIPVEIIKKIHEKGENCEKYLKSGRVDMLVNTISYGSQIEQEGYDLRRIAVELAIPCITSLDTAKEVLRVMAASSSEPHVEAIQDYVKEN